ncbi:hypothetical protein [Mariniblastus fucicola]|nr:hypothetical protein [Mariniblastus fucicola]
MPTPPQDPNPSPSSPTGTWVLVAMAFFLISLSFLIASRRNAVDIDLFHEMCLARQFAEEGKFPQTDAFAYTPTVDRVVHHEWGTGAIAYAVIEQLGFKSPGLMGLKYLLVALICGFCCLSAKLRGATWPLIVPGFALATIIGGQIGYTTIRAQLFTMLFLAIQFCLLALDRQGKKWWIIPWLILVVVWANVHAGIVAGLGIFCFYVLFRYVEPFLRKPDTATLKNDRSNHFLIAVAIASMLLLLVNPYGTNYPFYLWYGTTLDRPLINEWKPLLATINDPGFLTLIGVSLLLALVGFKDSWRERPFEVFVVLLTAYLAFKHVRHLSIYAVTWACVVPPGLMRNSMGSELARNAKRLAMPLGIFALAAGIYCMANAWNARFWEMQVPAFTEEEEPSGMLYPVGAVDFLKEIEFEGNLMTPFSMGAFVSWNLYPNVKVSIDSRYEVAYPPGSIEASFDFYDAKDGWQKSLESDKTDAVLVPNFKAVREQLDSLEGWHLLYSDKMFSIFTKQPITGEPVTVESIEFDWEF